MHPWVPAAAASSPHGQASLTGLQMALLLNLRTPELDAQGSSSLIFF